VTPAAGRAAADLIWDAWQGGAVLDALPEDCRPATRAEGYAIQAHLEARSAKPLAGWKIAATSAAGQRHIGVDGPLAGRLLAEMVYPDGATLPFGANRMRVAEAEFVFRMGRTLAPRATEYTLEEVLDAVAALHLGIEVPDSRFADFARAGGPLLIADDACARHFVLGPEAPPGVDWRAMDLPAHRVHCAVAGRYEREGLGANVLGDPRVALAWLANELSRHGVMLAAGQLVTTGTCVVPLEIRPGDAVTADFGELGRVAARFAAG
jgi:2-keto-4-pentenoate hydratase